MMSLPDLEYLINILAATNNLEEVYEFYLNHFFTLLRFVFYCRVRKESAKVARKTRENFHFNLAFFASTSRSLRFAF